MENILVTAAECAADIKDGYAADRIARYLSDVITDKNYLVLCVGSDKALDDCMGPLCGSLLENKIVLPVIGTLTRPVHAANLSFTLDKISLLYPQRKIIVVDAAKSSMYSRGTVVAFSGGLELTDCEDHTRLIGDISLAGVSRDENTFFKGEAAGLSDISAMAIIASTALRKIFG